MATVLVADPEDLLRPYAEEQQAAAKHGARFVFSNETPPRVRDAEVILSATIPVDADTMLALPRCRMIVRYGIGVDTIDVAAATAAGIVVANAPTYCVSEVADYTAGLIVSWNRRIPWWSDQLRRSHWPVGDERLIGVRRLSRLTLGLIGLGKIGQRVARRMAAFGMEILAYDPYLSDDAIRSHGAMPATFAALLRASDVVSLHVPLYPATHHLIDEHALAMMKPTALLVNTSRGKVVNEQALIAALKQDRLGGAALDVLADEPPAPDHPLLAMDPRRVIVTPHCAASSADMISELHREVAAAIDMLLDDCWPAATINPAVVPKHPLRYR